MCDTRSYKIIIIVIVYISLGTSYKNLGLCSFTDNDTCTHDYYVVYNKDDISEIVFVAEEQRSKLHYQYIGLQ